MNLVYNLKCFLTTEINFTYFNFTLLSNLTQYGMHGSRMGSTEYHTI